MARSHRIRLRGLFRSTISTSSANAYGWPGSIVATWSCATAWAAQSAAAAGVVAIPAHCPRARNDAQLHKTRSREASRILDFHRMCIVSIFLGFRCAENEGICSPLDPVGAATAIASSRAHRSVVELLLPGYPRRSTTLHPLPELSDTSDSTDFAYCGYMTYS